MSISIAYNLLPFKQHLGGDKAQLSPLLNPWTARRCASLFRCVLALDTLHESTCPIMDSHMIQVQCELLEREITAERNLLQAQEQLKAIRTMRRRVLAMVGNQGHTPIGLCPPEVHMTPNASTPASPVLTINVTDLPDEHKETKDSRNHRPISLNTPPRLGYPCSEPDITPLLTPEAQPQSAPANHHLTDTTTYTYEDHLQLSSGTASGCLKFAHSESPGVALTGCSSGIPPGTSYVDYELDHYISERFSLRHETSISVVVLFRGICSHTQRDKASYEPYFISPRCTEYRR